MRGLPCGKREYDDDIGMSSAASRSCWAPTPDRIRRSTHRGQKLLMSQTRLSFPGV